MITNADQYFAHQLVCVKKPFLTGKVVWCEFQKKKVPEVIWVCDECNPYKKIEEKGKNER